MNENVLRIYRRERAKGASASAAWRTATYTRSVVPAHAFLASLDDSPMRVSGKIGPFDVSVSVVVDDDARLGDDDVTGTFTDTYEEGCVKNTRRNWGTDYEWYRPSNYTLEYAYDEARKAGMSKSVARAAVAERIRLEMDDDAERQWFGIQATVRIGGEEVGSSSLWGIDSIPGYDAKPYFIEVATEQIDEAIHEARKALPAALQAAEAQVAMIRAAMAEDLGVESHG